MLHNIPFIAVIVLIAIGLYGVLFKRNLIKIQTAGVGFTPSPSFRLILTPPPNLSRIHRARRCINVP